MIGSPTTRALAAALLLAAGSARAAAAAPARQGLVAEAPRPDPAVWYAFAAPFYMPETSGGLGGVAGVHLPLCPGCETSTLELQGAYTLRQQLVLEANSQLFPGERLGVAARLKYAVFPDRFYGVGPDAPDGGEAYTPRTIDALVSPELVLVPGLRAGPTVHLYRQEILARDAGGALASGAVPGSGDVTALGAGATATWDGRDSRFFPTRGTLASAWYAWYPGAIGAHGDFGRAVADVRQYLPLARRHVLALQLHGEASHGPVPFALMPRLGGDSLLRGYACGRYRDAALWAAQAEYRFPVIDRFGGVAFVGAGDVAPDPAAFTARTTRVAGGLGARVRVTPDGVNARLDLATTGDGVSAYVVVLEAF